MTEEQKYQGALYKAKKQKTGPNNNNNNNNNKNNNNKHNNNSNNDMAHRAYVEEVPDYEGWNGNNAANPPPAAPSPPGADDINVFEYMVNATPAASIVALPVANGPSEAEPSEHTQLVRFEETKNYDDMDQEMMADDEALVSYGSGPIPVNGALGTPAARVPRERKKSDRDSKKDKKRKRLHVETHDLDMPDAPVLQSGLTGDLSRMMTRPQTFPPSPDYSGSGGEFAETPASPMKKSKSSKHHRSSRPVSGIGNNLLSMLTGSNQTSKSSKRKSTTSTSKKRSSTHRSKRLEGAKEPKLLEYKSDRSHARDSHNGAGAMVMFGQRADLFFSMVNKGPESERGCSVNKALKRFHRERGYATDALPKPLEEKELFKSLRLRKNDRGEIVLFSI